MNKFLRLTFNLFLIICSFVFLAENTYAQLTGIKTIPGSYATIAEAVADLNLQGVGSGGVIFNVAAGYTENTAAALNITATGINGNTIYFQKSGTGNNPIITRTDAGSLGTSTIGADGDAVIRLSGTDYITFDGIDVMATSTGIEYGYYTFKPDGTNGCQYVSILNCTITMAGGSNFLMGINVSNGPISVSASTGVTVTAASGSNSNVTIDGNTIIGAHTGIYARGGSAAAYYDEYIKIGDAAGNVIQNFGGSTAAYGIYTIYNTSVQVAKNTLTGTGSTTMYGIYTGTATNGSCDIFGNTVSLVSTAAGTQYVIYNLIGSSGDGNTVSIYDNIIENCTQDAAGTATTYLLYNTGAAFRISIYGNILRNNSKVGTSGASYLLYSSGGGASGTVNIYDNAIFGNNYESTGTTYCLYTNEVATSNKEVYNNQIYNNTGGGATHGIYSSLGIANIFQNNIYNITSTSTGTTAASATGLTVSSGTTINIYNNFVSDIKAPACAATDAVRGINITSTTATSTVGLYYNTVYLNASSSGANFGSSGIYQTNSTTATTAALEMQNNIIVNNSTPVGTGLTVAFRRSASNATLNNYAETSNNNLFYAGTPGAANLIFSAGTDADQLMQAFQLRVAPRESVSINENPPFLNVAATPYNLHMNAAIPTQVESGGIPVPFIAFDFDGDARNATTPDMGADEFIGISADLTPPEIAYTPLPNIFTTDTRTLTAAITDASGVPTAGTGRPVLYWRINSGTYNAATGTHISGDTYSFTFGSGVALGDIVYYYIAAQDNASTPNVAVFPFAGAGGFTANPPAAAIPPTTPSKYHVLGPPMTGTYTVGLAGFNTKTGKNVYFEKRTRTVLRDLNGADSDVDLNEFSQDRENPVPLDLSPRMVEVTEVYYEMMENGKPFDTRFFSTDESRGIYPTLSAATTDLNLRGAIGPVTFLLVDSNYPNETYPIDILDFTGSGASSPVLIKPAPGVQAVIPGSVDQTTATFRVGSGSYVTLDGSNTVGGTTKDLRIVGLALGTHPAVHLYGTASNNIFKNLILESKNNSTGSGTFLFGAGPAASDNNIVQNCEIKNIDTELERPFVAIYFFSTNTGVGNKFFDCSVYDFSDHGIRLQGAPIADILVSGCDVYMTSPSSKGTIYGIYANRVDNLIVEKSTIRNLISASPSTIMGMYLAGNTTSGNYIIRNNFVSISGINSLSAGTLRGIDYFGVSTPVNSAEIVYNSIYIGGIGVSAGTTTALTKRGAAIRFQAFNNTVYNARSNGVGTGKHYAVYFSNVVADPFEVDYNNYLTDGTGGVFGYLGTADVADLTSWQAALSKDMNSISGNPGYFSGDDLHIIPSYNTLSNLGITIPSVTTDIDGDTRLNPPDIGADEYTYVPASVLNPTDVTAAAVNPNQINISFTPNAANNNVVIVYNLTGIFTTPAGTPPAPGGNLAGGIVVANTTTSPINHTMLEPITTYFYKLYSYNGSEYSTGVTAFAKTPCSIVTAFSQNFDGVATPALPDCWFKVGTTGSVSTQTSNNFSPPNCLYIYSSSTTAIAMVSLPPVSNAGAGTHQLRFMARASITAGGVVQFGYLTDPLDQSTFVMISSFTTASTTYAEHIIYPGTAAGSNTVFAFRHTGSPANSVLIDNVSWEPLPNCPPVTNLSAAPTNNSAMLNWQPNGSETMWDIEYGPTPFTPTGTPNLPGVTTRPYNLTGLTSETGYAFYVRANCGGEVSTWTGPVNFTTTCDPVTAFTQNFDASATLPACWVKVSTTGTVSINTTNPYSAPNCLYFYGGSTTPAVVSMPPVSNAGAGTHWLKLYARGSTATGGIIQAGYLTNPGDPESFVFVSSVVVSTLTYEPYYFFLGTAPGSNQVLALRHPGTPATYMRIDDVSWEPIPACPPPLDLTASGTSTTTAILGWTQPLSGSMWDIEYGPVPFTPTGTPTISGITTNPYTLTGLTASTTYAYYVRANCGSGSFSSWSGPVTFNTACESFALPLSESFNGAAIPACWDQTSTISPRWTVVTTANAGGTPNEMKATYVSGTGVSRFITPPLVTTGLASLKLTFSNFFDDYGAGLTYKIQSSVDGITWSDEEWTNQSGNGNQGPEIVNTTISSNVGSTTYIAWVIEGNHFQTDGWFIDDVIITEPYVNDVSTFSIDVPGSNVAGAIEPSATVKNYGSATQTFNVQMTITGGYTSTKAVTALLPGESRSIIFDTWNAVSGQFTINVCTQLAGDQNPSNDCKTKSIGVYSGSYSAGTVFPTTTYLGTGASYQNFVFSFGGNTASTLGTESYKYNVLTDTWTTIASLPSGRRVLASATVGNFIYVIGGSDMASVYQNTVYKYDIAGNSWTTVAPLPLGMAWHKAVTHNNLIYVVGGHDGTNYLSTVYVYDAAGNTWSAATSMPSGKIGGALTAVGNKLIYVGGGTGAAISNEVVVGTIDAVNPLVISWITAEKSFPGIPEKVYSEYDGLLSLAVPTNEVKNHVESVYPSGGMYRFDASPWGSDAMIIAGGSPAADWIPADPGLPSRYQSVFQMAGTWFLFRVFILLIRMC
jgi:hypothetical protein